MSEARKRVREAADDARCGDDLTMDPMSQPMIPLDSALDSPLDEETRDESASTQMGGWESPRRGANEEGQ